MPPIQGISDQKSRKPVLIDTDCGVDDALAIILALRSPELDVRSIVTVAGNVEVDRCTRNVLRVLALLGPEQMPSVAQGTARPLRRSLLTAKEVHGRDGLGDAPPSGSRRAERAVVRSNGVRKIIDFCDEWGSNGTIIAIGPLTNIARAWMRERSAVANVGRIVSMGGVFPSDPASEPRRQATTPFSEVVPALGTAKVERHERTGRNIDVGLEEETSAR